MNLGFNKSVLSKLQKFQEETLSRSQLKQLFYDNQYEIMRIWGETEGKTEGHPRRTLRGEEVYSIFGPRNQRPWSLMGSNEYINGGYIILYDVSRIGFRVFPFNRITKVEYNGITYNIR
jgi:hypothetical protein